MLGVGGCAAAALALPGLAGHPSTTSPVGLMLLLDWAHLAAGRSGSEASQGCSCSSPPPAGRRVAVLAVVVPRFSRAAMAAVAVLLATGIIASVVHLPTLGVALEHELRQGADREEPAARRALVLGAVNNLRSRPRLRRGRAAPRPGAR